MSFKAGEQASALRHNRGGKRGHSSLYSARGLGILALSPYCGLSSKVPCPEAERQKWLSHIHSHQGPGSMGEADSGRHEGAEKLGRKGSWGRHRMKGEVQGKLSAKVNVAAWWCLRRSEGTRRMDHKSQSQISCPLCI